MTVDSPPPVALVTGAGGGIGRALLPFMHTAGYLTLAVDRCPPVALGCLPMRCDLADPVAIDRCVTDLEPGLRERITAVVHLAGVYPTEAFTGYTTALWDQVFAVNVRSVFLLLQGLVRAGVPALSTVVLTSSAAAKVGSRDPAYAASKAALVGLGHHLSLELADRGVRVNTLLPGLVDTPMSRRQSAERRAFHVSRTLARRPGRPEEIAQTIMFLIGNGSSYLWGASIDANGGMAF
jgi:NAD(P)-dependent dehydrogenase (short-subunit alcohol dehydrogenase family)